MTVHELLLRKRGEREVSRLVRRAMWKLQRLPLLDQDPHLAELGFKNLWDQVCWELQKSHGPYWLLCEHEVDEVIRTEVEGLSQGEQQLLWLCTPEGGNWFDHEAEHYDSSWAAVNDIPSSDSDLVSWVRSATFTAAADWSNSRLRLANEMGRGAQFAGDSEAEIAAGADPDPPGERSAAGLPSVPVCWTRFGTSI